MCTIGLKYVREIPPIVDEKNSNKKKNTKQQFNIDDGEPPRRG